VDKFAGEVLGAIAAGVFLQIAVFLVAWGSMRERVNTHERRIEKTENKVEALSLDLAALKGER
jgi:hypothetical protein